MRNALGAVVAATALLAPHANAAGAVTLTCSAHYNAYGVGTTSGTASCTVTGIRLGSASMTFTSSMNPALCPAQETATGRITGAIDVDVYWQRYGDSGPIATTGEVNGVGTIEVFVTSPVGNPCGGSVDATFVITFGGT